MRSLFFIPAVSHRSPHRKSSRPRRVRRRVLDTSEQRRQTRANLGNVGVRHLLDALHPGGRVLRVLYGAACEEAAQPPQFLDAPLHPHADERVAAAQMMVEERQRSAHREAVEPERDLRKFHRQRVLVHAVDAPLQHHPPDDRLVRQQGLVDDPVGL